MENEEPRLCSECRYLVGRRSYPEMAAEWRCHHPANVISASTDLVTGSIVYLLRYTNCYAARSSAEEEKGCGSVGRWFEQYQQPNFRVAKSDDKAEELLKELD